ncbi:MAG: ABC transporter ATP-binding protein [Xanthomonadales bacterium]|jgi:putative ABC transport system ATP-binding protein|nr:ABC transporter ATP-binding protein [Xanthomonadales bacterium]MDH3923579.1 ABC transporter ATP-binding protein [Xanthomonadales bacterium]MDH3939950.1 ABC transporter ATP-binding protein [Xanthomonadales bacterium]MDH3999939.1 ABC transporter ATP-binding protein [Xanthomonadales bacterium]
MAEIKCVELCKDYQQGDAVIKALDHVTIDIEQGSFLCLSGPSGSGKTTLLNMIGGLDELDSGQISIDGERVDLLGKGPLADLRLHHIGFVFQAYNLIPVLTAQENVEFVMQVQGVPAKERKKKALDILREVGLEGMEHRRPAELSGGQQQRVAVARAIVSQPKLVLADEPTANLDSVSATHLMELFCALNSTHGVTFLIATHDERVMRYAKRLIKMQDGKIIEDREQEPS